MNPIKELFIYLIAFLILASPFIIIGLIIYIICSSNKQKTSSSKNTDNANPVWKRITLEDGSYFYECIGFSDVETKTKCLPYVKRDLLTKTEHDFWVKLKEQCNARGIIICPKVRMEDFIGIEPNNKQKESWRGKIKSRHIDFILCDNDMNVLAGIELDDNSHLQAKAQKIDEFKNEVFENIDIPLFRVIVNKGNYPSQINKILNALQPANTNNMITAPRAIEPPNEAQAVQENSNQETKQGRFSGIFHG